MDRDAPTERPRPSERAYDDVLRAGLEALMRRYAQARPGEPFGREHEIRGLFEDLRRALAASDAVRAFPTIKVEWSAGAGSGVCVT